MLAMANSMSVPPPLPPELLLAAKRGDWRKLDDLMSMRNDIDIDIEEADMHYGSDSVLHVVASSSSGGDDGEEPLMRSFCNKAKHLLGARNARGDTPLHCAVRAGNTKMVSHLIDLLARRQEQDDGGGASSVLQVVLRKENKRGETVLHDAIRWGDEEMVGVLMSADAKLARFPRNGVSPLYLAILLERDDIAEQLYEMDSQLSYSGPDGQNAMHVAVVRSEWMTKKLLEWNQSLIKQGDRSSGSTPLHCAASWQTRTSGRRAAKLILDFLNAQFLLDLDAYDSSTRTSGRAAKLLLDAYESSAYQSDSKGSFPIHVAALRNNRAVVSVLLKKCPDCAQLQDAEGKTFLHVAALKGYRGLVRWIVSFLRGNPMDACDVKRFSSIMNIQDNQGNTALHYAAKSQSYLTMRPFIQYREVQLNLQNNEGKTALDLARMMTPRGLDPEVKIPTLLRAAGGRPGFRPRGEEDEFPEPNEEKEAQKIKDSTATIGIASVLIITISFAVAFQFPGGYSTGDNKQPAGTPELAKVYSFEAFVVANNLAAFCSAVATLSVMFAGVTTVADLVIRQRAFVISIFFLNSSARSLAAAFAFGTYAVLAPVARAAAILTWVLTSFLVADIAWFTSLIIQDRWVLLNRRGGTAVCLRVAVFSVGTTVVLLWPYVVIAGFLAYIKVHGIH